MNGESLLTKVKRTSSLRRMPPLEAIGIRSACGGEGDICAFELPCDASPITVESATGRLMTIAPGDVFLGTPGYRQARRWAVGSIPDGGLVPGNDYWVLSESGVVGELISQSHLEMGWASTLPWRGVRGPRREAEHPAIRRDEFRPNGSSRTHVSYTRDFLRGRQDHRRSRCLARAAPAGP
jgi:hypothetical protein